MNTIIWKGTASEASELADAINHHCECQHGTAGAITKICPAHSLWADQHTLDRLLFVRRRFDDFAAQEWLRYDR